MWAVRNDAHGRDVVFSNRLKDWMVSRWWKSNWKESIVLLHSN